MQSRSSELEIFLVNGVKRDRLGDSLTDAKRCPNVHLQSAQSDRIGLSRPEIPSFWEVSLRGSPAQQLPSTTDSFWIQPPGGALVDSIRQSIRFWVVPIYKIAGKFVWTAPAT